MQAGRKLVKSEGSLLEAITRDICHFCALG